MRMRTSAAATLLLVCGCGGGGGGSVSGALGLTGNLQLVGHSPADVEVQVAPDSSIRLQFDGIVVPECLRDAETWLAVGDSEEAIPGTFASEDAGRSVVFTPSVPLARETDYTFHLSPLTCDTAARILETPVSFTFRTLDDTPPQVSGSSVLGPESGVSRTEDLVIEFSEPLLPESVDNNTVYLADHFGNRYPLDLSVDRNRIVANPVVDLAGSRNYILAARGGSSGVKDRAGNLLEESWSSSFTSVADFESPLSVASWPGPLSSASPLIQPFVVFDESVDPLSVEPASVWFADEYSNVVPFQVHSSPDHKTLRLEPTDMLVPGRNYSLAFMSGLAGVTDVSGNSLGVPALVSFRVGTDATSPAVVSTFPLQGEGQISPNVEPVIGFSEPLDRSWLADGRIALSSPEGEVPIDVVLQSGDSQVRVLPQRLLDAGTQYRLLLRGGHDGLHDLAGNILPADSILTFTVSDDPTLPGVILGPEDGVPSAPPGVHFTAVFDSPMDPTTVGPETVVVTTSSGMFVPGQVALSRKGRVVTFVPDAAWTQGASYTATLRGGAMGLREESGNWLTGDATSRFRIGSFHDNTPPIVSVTLNNTPKERQRNMSVPPSGFTIDVNVFDPSDYSGDVGSVNVLLLGPGEVPDPDHIFEHALVRTGNLNYRVPDSDALQVGAYTVLVTAADLSGNEGVSESVSFQVHNPTVASLPFERAQVVWVRFDLDRNGNGRPDFEDDLLLMGLITEDDPAGTNRYLIEVVRDGMMAQANELFGRGPTGSPLDVDSVAVRLTHREPFGVPHMQMSVGGFDPEGIAGRGYGDESSGILGRATYDYRNSLPNERNISARPGLGVFPAEMFLFQANIHDQIYPSFLTTFGKRFIELTPEMGGTPGGSHSLDAAVLSPDFDFANGSTEERARYLEVFEAADDWATVIGIILAHEIGHSTGLVATGPNPRGLHGDGSLHNQPSGATDVMSSAVSYTTMVLQPHSFRDLNIAYLRQRLLLK